MCHRQAKKAHFGVLWSLRAIAGFHMSVNSIRTTNVVQTEGGKAGKQNLLVPPLGSSLHCSLAVISTRKHTHAETHTHNSTLVSQVRSWKVSRQEHQVRKEDQLSCKL